MQWATVLMKGGLYDLFKMDNRGCWFNHARYVAMWLGGGWGELLISASSSSRVKMMIGLLFAISAALALKLAPEAEFQHEFFDGWLMADVMWMIASFVFGAVADPLATYGVFPWQWSTWWLVLMLPFTVWAFLHFYLSFRDDVELGRMLASPGFSQ